VKNNIPVLLLHCTDTQRSSVKSSYFKLKSYYDKTRNSFMLISDEGRMIAELLKGYLGEIP